MIVCGTVELLGGLRAISLASLDNCLLFGFAFGATFGAGFFAVDFVIFLLVFLFVGILFSPCLF
jgi:hypothetical protein